MYIFYMIRIYTNTQINTHMYTRIHTHTHTHTHSLTCNTHPREKVENSVKLTSNSIEKIVNCSEILTLQHTYQNCGGHQRMQVAK